MEIIHLVENLELSVRQMLAELDLVRSIFIVGIVDTLRTDIIGCRIGL